MWQAIVNRQEGFLNFTPQNHRAFKQTRVAVFGAGGNGVVMENLLRMGFERFEILNPDVVDDTNLNRLPFTRHHIGRPKVEAWRDFLLDVNPGCTVRIHRHKVTCRDAGLVEDIVDRADLIFLQTTSAEANLVIARACAAKGRRMIVGTGSSGAWIVSTFMHDNGITLESIAGFGTENTPLEAIDYKALLPKYLALTFYPGRKAQYIDSYRDRMLRGPTRFSSVWSTRPWPGRRPSTPST